MPHLSRASYSWKKYPAFLTAEVQQFFLLYQVLSQKIRTRFGQPQLFIMKRRLPARFIHNQLSILTVRIQRGIRQATDSENSLNKFELTRRTVQSCRKICLFLLEECSFPAAVNDPSHRFPFVGFHQAERN
jgi:hypothetical protein